MLNVLSSEADEAMTPSPSTNPMNDMNGLSLNLSMVIHSTSNHPVVPHGPYQIWPNKFLNNTSICSIDVHVLLDDDDQY